MSTNRKIAHNTIIQATGKIVSTAIGLIVVGMMTRYLGQKGYGQYTIVIAFLQFFGILVDMGLTIMTLQMISEPGVNIKKILSNIFTIRLFSAIIFLSIAPIIVLFFPYDPIVKVAVAVTAISFVFIALNQIVIGVFQKNLRMDKVALAEIGGRIVLLILVSLAIIMGYSLLAIMGAIVAGSFVNFFLNFLFSRKFVKISLRFDFDIWKKIISRSWPIAISIVLNLIYLKADTIILSLFHPQSVVGLYGAPYRIVEIMVTFPFMFIGLILPLLTNSWAKQKLDSFRELMQNAFDTLIILAIPMIIGTFFLARKIMVFVAGDQFAQSGDVLKILILATGIIFVGSLFSHIVVVINKQRTVILGYLATAIVALIGYLIFIPKYSLFGAAWMTVFAETMMAIITFVVVIKTTKVWPSAIKLYKAILAGLFMAIPLYFMPEQNLFLLIGLAISIYFVALYFIKGISKEIILEILKLRKRGS